MNSTMKKTLKAVFLVAITLAITIGLSNLSKSFYQQPEGEVEQQYSHANSLALEGEAHNHDERKHLLLPSKRVSRFLAQSNDRLPYYEHKNNGFSLTVNLRGNQKTADHCHKDYEMCSEVYGKNKTCCGNKCYNLQVDKNYCGSCHKQCKYTDYCCGGKCVNLSYDKSHCGSCDNKCSPGQYCVYGMCDYA